MTSVMLGRGALISPWLFREIREGRDWLPTAAERVGVLWRLVELQREHFGVDERGQNERGASWPGTSTSSTATAAARGASSPRRPAQHPLLQSRVQAAPPASPLERLLGDARPETHQGLAEVLLAAPSPDEARRAPCGSRSRSPAGGSTELRVSPSEIAG